MEPIYLDNSATTRPCPAAVQAMQDALSVHWHNPSALYKPALEAEKLVRAARTDCLRAAGAPAGSRLVFTSGGTEADNLAILGHMRGVRQPGRVLMLQVEHPAVRSCAEELRRMGHQVQEIPVTAQGTADLDWLEGRLGPDVRMLCVMQVNNETGAIQPLRQIAALRDRLCPQAALHVDGVQGFLRVPMDWQGVQSYAFSGHKIHACKGIGGLIVRQGHKLTPLLHGGGQEQGERSGTENTPGILAMAAAVRAFPAESVSAMRACKRQLWQAVREKVPGCAVNGPEPDSPDSAPHILNLSLPPVRSQTMLFALEGEGIYVSAGSACSSHQQKVSAVLNAMGLPARLAESALRFSLCPENTPAQMELVAEAIARQWQLLSRYVRR